MKITNIITGVHNFSDTKLYDCEFIDLTWEEHLKECKNKDHDFCGPQETDRCLFGSWIKKKGLYQPKRGGLYAAIYNTDHNTVQVVKSRFAIQCNRCSPCYPGQGDVDTPGDLWAYCLPPELFREEWLKENGHRIYERHPRDPRRWRNWIALSAVCSSQSA